MSVHAINLQQPFFDDFLDGSKTFEVRVKDRDYRKGDVVILIEVGNDGEQVTPTRIIKADIGFVQEGFGLKEEYVAFSLLNASECVPKPKHGEQDDSTFGEKIVKLRKDKGLKQPEAAASIGVSVATLSSYEQNLSTPKLEVLAKICELYQVTADWLLGKEEQTTACDCI